MIKRLFFVVIMFFNINVGYSQVITYLVDWNTEATGAIWSLVEVLLNSMTFSFELMKTRQIENHYYKLIKARHMEAFYLGDVFCYDLALHVCL